MCFHFHRLYLALACLLAGSTGCAQTAFLFVNAAAAARGQEVHYDLRYGDAEHQQLNVYAPRYPVSERPVIVFFYGGGWSMGDKDDYRFAAEPFCSADFLVVVPDYGKFPQYRYPAFMRDAALALRWVYDHIEEYGGDRDQIVLAGHSAGAHIAALAATDRRFLDEVQVPRDAIRAVVGLAGPYDFVPEEPRYKQVFSDAGKNARLGMPANYVDGSQPPMLLLYGLDDDVVYERNIRSMEEKVERFGGQLETRYYPHVDHIDIVAALSRPLRGRAPVVEDILGFLGRLLPAVDQAQPDS